VRPSGGGRLLVFTGSSSYKPTGLVSQHTPVNTSDTSPVYHTTQQCLVILNPNASTYPPPLDCDDLQSILLLPQDRPLHSPRRHLPPPIPPHLFCLLPKVGRRKLQRGGLNNLAHTDPFDHSNLHRTQDTNFNALSNIQ